MGPVGWTLQDWTPVLFPNESRFCADFTDRRARVWRRNERFAPLCIAEHDRDGGDSVIVWAGISVHVQAIEIDVRYVNKILEVHVRP